MTDSLEAELLPALRQLARGLDVQSFRLATTAGITVPQFLALQVLRELGPVTAGQLAQGVSVTRATITGIIDRLLTSKLVTRTHCSIDRRRVTVDLTEGGRKLIDAQPSGLQEDFIRRLHELSESDRTDLCRMLHRVAAMMRAEPPTGQSLPALGTRA